MIGALNYLGVKAQERRSVIFLLIGFFVVGNGVWLFMGLGLFELRESRAGYLEKNKSLARAFAGGKDYYAELQAYYEVYLDEIKSQGGSEDDDKTLSFNQFVATTRLKEVKSELKTLRGLEDVKFATDGSHAQKLMELVEKKARRSGLSITRSRGSQGSARSSKEFEEYKRTISFSSGLIELVDFLKNVSEEQSMIRVSDMKILPTPDKRQLKVDLTFIASFPKPETDSKSSKAYKKKGKKK
jgi:hypothetical protein|tara:strand:+ start:1313 stop:2038 length:726 start_codon:yes stop_codon:yes gene_type:complete